MDTLKNFNPEIGNNSVQTESPISFPKTIEGRILYYIAVIFSLFQVGIASHLIEVTSQLQLSTHVGFFRLVVFSFNFFFKKQRRFLQSVCMVISNAKCGSSTLSNH